MKLVDTNVWLALALSKHIFHGAATVWLAAEPAPKELLFCRATQQSFLRLLTTAGVMSPYGMLPMTNAEAWDLYEQFLTDPRIGTAHEPAGLEGHWKSSSARTTSSPKLWMDGYLASFAIGGGCQFVTTDQAFAQFLNLNVQVLTRTP
jgi:toxin-antitoxin system PIN domain toxin